VLFRRCVPRFAALVLPLLVLAGPAQANFTDALVHKLSANYEVATGSPRLYTNADCPDTFAVLNNCLGNNPAAPYIIPIVPAWPDEFSDPALKNVVGETPNGYSGTYRFDPREAIVVLGTLPPPGRYMSLQTYVATNQGTIDASSDAYTYLSNYPSLLSTFFSKLPENPSRIESFSSVGNSINNVNIDQQSSASFGTQRFFIITPDVGMDQAVRGALNQLGVTSADIFTEPVSYSGIQLGLGASADDFLAVMRYALPNDPNAGNQWRQTLPLSVLRVRELPSSTRPPQPFPVSVYDSRSATPEAPFASDLNNLVNAICNRWAGCSLPAPVVDLQSDPLNQIGPACREIGMNCLADGQDASYYFTGALPLDHGEIYAMVDTLATETGNATYVSLGINDSSKLLGVASVEDPALKGSAGSYASTVRNSGKFFAYYVTRNCAGLESLTDRNCLSITNEVLPPGVSIKLSLRDYVRPLSAGGRGPDSAHLLKPVLLRVATPSSAASTVTLGSSQNPSTQGQSVTFTATVSCSSTATGTVTFTIDGAVGASVTLSGAAANFTMSTLSIGRHSITVAYSGDGNCGPATSTTLTQVVNAAVTEQPVGYGYCYPAANAPPPGAPCTPYTGSGAYQSPAQNALQYCMAIWQMIAQQQACIAQTLGNVGGFICPFGCGAAPKPSSGSSGQLPGAYCTMPDGARQWVPQGAPAPAGCT
jgi:Bacterial Ig-like domain (group 3)